LADEQYLAAFCGKIARNASNRSIPYNLKIDNDVRFNAKGELEVGKSFTGLSCATFVVAIFRSAGNPLLDTSAWPAASTEDAARQKAFVDYLRNSGDPDMVQQAALIKTEIGGSRAAPEEVAGACLEDSYPVAHPECEAAGKYIVGEIDRAYAARSAP
jgi:hypothetical protein